MTETRLVAFTDGIFAIIITIMILGFEPPKEATFMALWSLRHAFTVYLVSFFTLAVYWVNHHHLFAVVRHVSGAVLWANMLVLLASSFFPFATAWLGKNTLNAFVPAVFYGMVNLLTNLAWWCLTWLLVRDNKRLGEPATLLRRNQMKSGWTALGNFGAILTVFIWPPLVLIGDVLAMAAWVLPDRHIERHLGHRAMKGKN